MLLRKLAEKKEHLDITRLKRFKPNPGFQESFMKSRAPIRLMLCGNQGGKTSINAVEGALYALGEHPYKKIRTPNTGILTTAMSFKDGIEDLLLPKIREFVGSKDIKKIKNNSQGIPTSIYWRSGSITYLKSAEQDDDSFEGKIYDWAGLDEPMRREIFIAIKRGMLTTNGHLWWSMTPLSEPWIYEELYLKAKEGKDKNIEIFEGSSTENIKISKEAHAEFASRLTQDEIETRLHGKFRHLSGRVFKEYKPDVHLIPSFDIPYHWPVWCSIDPHRKKPHAVLFIAVGPDGKKYACNEIFVSCDVRTLAGYIKDIGEQYNVVDFLIDTSAQEDGWEKVSFRQLLQDYGREIGYEIKTRLAQKKNKKNSGITLMNQLFKNEEFFVMEHCKRFHKELMNQIYKVNKRDKQIVLEEPQKKYDDMCDNARYILIENPKASGRAQVKNYGSPYKRIING